MKYILLIIILSISSVRPIFGQPQWEWVKSYGGLATQSARATCIDSYGYVYMTGYINSEAATTFDSITVSPAYPNYSTFLAKFDSSGIAVWVQLLPFFQSYNSDLFCKNDYIYVAGTFDQDTIVLFNDTIINYGLPNTSDFVFIKMDLNGNLIWNFHLGGVGHDDIKAISADANNNVVIAGATRSPSLSFGCHTIYSSGNFVGFIAKYDPSGNCLWVRSSGGNNQVQTADVDCGPEGNIYLTGNGDSGNIQFAPISINGATNQMYLAKFDSAGSAIWIKNATRTSGADIEPHKVVAHSSNSIYLGGRFANDSMWFNSQYLTITSGLQTPDLFMIKYNDDGNVTWAFTEGGTDTELMMDYFIDAGENIYIYAAFESALINFTSSSLTLSGGLRNQFVAKYDAGGLNQWVKQISGNTSNLAGGVCSDGSGSIYVASSWPSSSIYFDTMSLTIPAPFIQDLCFAKLYEPGISAISDNYFHGSMNCQPNPAVNTCLISENSFNYVYIEVYNSTGHLLLRDAFNSSYQLELAGWHTGIYIVRLINEKSESVKSMIMKIAD